MVDARKERKSEVRHLDVGLNIASLDSKNNDLAVGFVYSVRYLPNGSYLNIGGTAILEGDKGEAFSAVQKWKKDKKLTGDLGEQVANQLTNASALNAVFITRVLDMAPPFLLPKIKLTE